tara:strand:- start:17 stop:184 length:168 start_codon:yes stop_codon:yes gene_type:complete
MDVGCHVEHITIQKEDSMKHLVLVRGRYLSMDSEICEKGFYLIFAHFKRMAFVVK